MENVEHKYAVTKPAKPDTAWRRMLASPRVMIGGLLLLAVLLLCIGTLPFTLSSGHTYYYDNQAVMPARVPPGGLAAEGQNNTAEGRAAVGSIVTWFGSDGLGRSVLSRSLLGGVISLSVGIAAATISVILGVMVGLLAGYRGGWTDSALMRTVDVLYGLPYILLVILFRIAFEPQLVAVLNWVKAKTDLEFSAAQLGNLIVLFSAIGLVSWLTMARVVRGQVLSLRGQPFIEAARAAGLPETRIFLRHILPNLVGPIVVYTTLTIPQAILQESFLSFLGVGVSPPLPTWGSLAAEALGPAINPINSLWWMLLFPCIFLVLTLLALNFVGDGLRDVFDPRRDQAKL
jgi:ABC-type dipeptide/oligopeptide/nickel transport system permease subunit